MWKRDKKGISVNWLYVVKGQESYQCKLAVCGKGTRKVSL